MWRAFLKFPNGKYYTKPALNFITLRKTVHKLGDKSRGNYNNLLAITWARCLPTMRWTQ